MFQVTAETQADDEVLQNSAAPSPQAVVSAGSQPQSPASPADPVVGIVSHSHEEVEISPRVLLLASVPHTVQVEKEQAQSEQARPIRTPVSVLKPSPLRHEIILPDVYALSPFAHLLVLPSESGPNPTMMPHARGFAGQPARQSAPPAVWSRLAREAEEIFGLDAKLILAVIQAESAFDHRAESPAGAQGAMQVMPTTQVELGLIDPFDPRANVYAGTQYLASLIRRFGAVEQALAAYNAGPAQVEKYGGIPPFEETRQFVRRVMAFWQTNTSMHNHPD